VRGRRRCGLGVQRGGRLRPALPCHRTRSTSRLEARCRSCASSSPCASRSRRCTRAGHWTRLRPRSPPTFGTRRTTRRYCNLARCTARPLCAGTSWCLPRACSMLAQLAATGMLIMLVNVSLVYSNLFLVTACVCSAKASYTSGTGRISPDNGDQLGRLIPPRDRTFKCRARAANALHPRPVTRRDRA
jgi:hypothetical protein